VARPAPLPRRTRPTSRWLQSNAPMPMARRRFIRRLEKLADATMVNAELTKRVSSRGSRERLQQSV
jgi:hypothetical protein